MSYLYVPSMAVLGVVFHEALRFYRALNGDYSFIPRGFASSRSDKIVYTVVMLVFCLFAAALAVAMTVEGQDHLQQGATALWLGFSIPMTPLLLKNNAPEVVPPGMVSFHSDDGESHVIQHDDLESEIEIERTGFFSRLKTWLTRY